MKMINKILVLAFALALCISCDDILEDDITNGLILTVFPTENAVVESNVVAFQWNVLDGADNYRVQIYNINQIMVFDTLVSNYTVVLPLTEGTYQWRVRGENSAYQSTYSFPVTFEVNQSLDLTAQQVILSSPVNNFITNLNNFTLSWETLSAADYYKLEIIDATNGGIIVYQQDNITTTNVTLNNTIVTQDAQYTWKVKGINTTSETVYSSRSFSIDTVVPNQPQNSLPANNSTQVINQDINFSWTIPVDSGTIQSTISYVIEIATDIAFTNIIQTSNASGTTFQQSFTTARDYYWRVRAKDIAGNIGANSYYFKFTVN